MKKLILRRHSITDGLQGTIGQKGIDLAEHIGQETDDEENPNQIFHGPMVSTAQTALAYCRGLGYIPQLVTITFGLGDENFFTKLTSKNFNVAQSLGFTSFEAMLQAHTPNQVDDWARQADQAVKSMMSALADGDIGVGFFSNPNLQLVAWCYGAEHSGIVGWQELAPMEGIVLTVSESGMIRFIEKVGVTQAATA